MKVIEHHRSHDLYRRLFKRPIDLFLSLMAMVFLSPVLILISISVRVLLGKPVLFKQQRPGINEKIFTMFKFRTMTDEKNENGELLPDTVRLTKFGAMLRSTSLDELPELINILRGEMSFVGPRPQLVRDMVFMTDEQRERHSVRPGLSGLAQVSGRNAITWEEKLSIDIQYIKKITFIEDVRIVFLTISKVFKKEGISFEGMSTVDDYGDSLLKAGKIDQETYDKKQIEANKILTQSRF